MAEAVRDFSGVICKLCLNEGKETICRGWTGIATHVRKNHNVPYDKTKKEEFGEKTDKVPTIKNPDAKFNRANEPTDRPKRKYTKREDKTLGLRMGGRVVPNGPMTQEGDKLYIPAMIELTTFIEARFVQPDEH